MTDCYCEYCCNFDKEHIGMDGTALCELTNTLAYCEESAEDCKFFNIPAADVQEVKHGEWIPYYEEVEVYNSGGFKEKKQTGWICGKCKSKKSFTPYETENYCSNCGAKMDGGAELV